MTRIFQLPAGHDPNDKEGKGFGVDFQEMEALKEQERRATNVFILLVGFVGFVLGLVATIIAGLSYPHWKHILE